ncbi:hypothetical protein [Borrelia sp. RT5S]|uniref:hypothetical protein n=1 Tax=Borrelia sp. RT5S TaxID=2898581 RepID=UPI001E38B8DE|nr:hypothetical protein [Borrelia sp. RT5S]UGQ16783.1 hypothetical protein LSO06_05530 [Borrelia sp. RT5S]
MGFCAKGVLLDPLKQEGKHSDEKDLSGNLIENLLPSLIRLLDLMPRTDNPLDFALKSISSNRESEGNLDSSLSKAPKRRDFLNGPGSHLFSSNIQDKFNIKLDLHNGLKEFNWGKQFDGIGNARHKNPNTDLVQSNGTSLAGIEDATYSDFENKRIKDMLADTGKFETQVDMNDFILKTCGFKSLLARGETPSSEETLLDAVKLASRIKTGRHVQDNEEAVSVVYDLFKGDQSRLASIINKTDRSNSNACMLDNKPINEFENNECLSGDLVKNKIDGALASFSRNLDPNEGPDANSIISVSFKDNVQLLTDQIRDLLICVNSLDFEKNIIQPLSDAFLNMENAINNLTDSLKDSAQENCLGSNIHDYKVGSESSRMP